MSERELVVKLAGKAPEPRKRKRSRKAPRKRTAAQEPQEAGELDLRWYVIKLKPAMQVQAEIHLVKQGFYPYIPRLIDGLAIFPGYALLQIDLNGPQRWQAINSTHGVDHFLPLHTERPLPLAKGFVEDLRAWLQTLATPQTAPTIEDVEYRYAIDEQVEIRTGSFRGQKGKVRAHKKGALEILLACMGRETSVYVNPIQLQPASVRGTSGPK